MDRTEPKWAKWAKMGKMGQMGKDGPNGPIWVPEMGQKWIRKWSQHGLKWAKMGQMAQMAQMAQMGKIGIFESPKWAQKWPRNGPETGPGNDPEMALLGPKGQKRKRGQKVNDGPRLPEREPGFPDSGPESIRWRGKQNM